MTDTDPMPVERYFATVQDIEAALERRPVLGQAQGILMERLGLTPERAHAFLRRASQTTNTKIEDVAADIVETRILPRTIAPSGSTPTPPPRPRGSGSN